MNNEPKNLTSRNAQKKPIQPVLIASEHTVYEYSTFLGHLLVGLADESVPVALVCPTDSDVDSLVSGAVEIIRHPSHKLPLIKWLNRNILIEQLEKFKPTVLHCLCESNATLTRQIAHQLDLPYVLMVNSLQKRWGEFPVSLSHCAKIIVPANSIAANIAKVHPRFAERTEQINIGTFVEQKCNCFSKPSRLPSMVIAHPLDNANDFENLFNAARHLVIDGYEFIMVIISGGKAEGQLRKLLAALGLTQVITIVPRLKPWRSVLAAGDIFIQPQPINSFNPLLLEAMSVGSAVAGCKGGVDDLIIENKTAIIFDPADELSIYSCLQQLLNRHEFARQIAKNAQQYLRENHSPSKMIAATLQTYYNA